LDEPDNLENVYEGRDLALRKVISTLARMPPDGADDIFQAVAPAVHLATRQLDGTEILDDLHHRVQAVLRAGLRAAYILTLLV
jgi:hypothetical protein